ncbi:hypothetical protein ACTJJ4_13065 [Microbacterium sp. 22195]|uniref:hypothetical protein n=1 Tax=Microbacterium sp. 22195 TaxID=3453891 RepID=UPI003F84BD54
MKGKIGLVVGLGVGYVLGTRAGRERYEQIKTQWLKVWHLDPVQKQVTRAQDFAKAQAAAVPGALWTGAVKVVKAVSSTGTPEQRLHSAADAAKDAAEDVAEAAKDAAAEAKRTTATKTTAKSTTSKSSGTAKKKTSEAE